VEAGWIEAGVASEFPDLRLLTVELEARATRSPPEVRDQLRDLADRMRGPQALMLRRRPVPWAYRVFFHNIGLDPDVDRTPVEALAVERLRAGGFESRNSLDDALTIAVVETGVGVWALDADRVAGRLGIRVASEGERTVSGRLVVADEDGSVAVLFGRIEPEHRVVKRTTRMRLFAVEVAGVPSLVVEEALWRCGELLG
jgi:DNA/RNA-binding domain of Phe-tRNA-synthetase-like protein